jgi:hypothetical protein
MAYRRARVLFGAFGLTVAMGVGFVGPASAASITPIKPLNPSTARVSITTPSPEPTVRRTVPLKGWSAKKIKNKAVRNARVAKSVHVTGSGIGDNEKLSWDGIFTKTSAKMRVTSTRQGTFQLIRVGSRLFISADRKFWGTVAKAEPDVVTFLAGKWVELLGNSKNASTLRSFLTMGVWTDLLSGIKVARRVAGQRIGGKKTVGLYEPGVEGAVLYVTATSSPYPVRAQSNDKTATVNYSQWNRRFHITPPPVVLRVPAT